jgi:polyisoprenoid-binding protein YceI
MNTLKNIFAATLGIIFLASFIAKNPQVDKFKIDASKSSVKWTGKKVTGAHEGSIVIKDGSVSAEGKTPKKGVVEMDMTSILCTDITDAETNGKFVGHLKSDDFFSVEKNPTSKLEIKKINFKGKDDYEIEGDLIIKGIKQAITFPATIKSDGKTLTAKGKVAVDRTKYDIRFRSGKFFENLGDKLINDDFELEFNIVATK